MSHLKHRQLSEKLKSWRLSHRVRFKRCIKKSCAFTSDFISFIIKVFARIEINRYLCFKLSQTYGSTISLEGIDEFYRLIPILKIQPPEGGSCPPPGPPQCSCGNQLIRSKIHLNGSLYSEFEENR